MRKYDDEERLFGSHEMPSKSFMNEAHLEADSAEGNGTRLGKIAVCAYSVDRHIQVRLGLRDTTDASE